MAFGNRSRDSFVRLSQGKEAPSVVTWGRYNRKALVRIPIIPTDEHGRADEPGHDRVPAARTDRRTRTCCWPASRRPSWPATRMTDLDARLARTAVTAQGHGGHREPRAADLPGDRRRARRRAGRVLEAGGVFTPNMLDRVIALLRA